MEQRKRLIRTEHERRHWQQENARENQERRRSNSRANTITLRDPNSNQVIIVGSQPNGTFGITAYDQEGDNYVNPNTIL